MAKLRAFDMTLPYNFAWQAVFAFHSPTNNWNGLLKDKNIKKYIVIQIEWQEHLLLYLNDDFKAELESYLNLKYNDIIVPVNSVISDYNPVPHKDYMPIYKPVKKFRPNKGKIQCF